MSVQGQYAMTSIGCPSCPVCLGTGLDYGDVVLTRRSLVGPDTREPETCACVETWTDAVYVLADGLVNAAQAAGGHAYGC